MQATIDHLHLIEQLLNLPGVRVLSAEINERDISIRVESTSDHAICHKCKQKATEFYCHGETLRLRHLPVCNRPVYLYLRPKRYRCQRCEGQPTTTERGEWYDVPAGCTRAFARCLLREMVNSTLSDVVVKHEIPYDSLRGLLQRQVSDTVDWSQFTGLKVIGLDEISLLKGHRNFVTIVSTRDEAGHPLVLAVLEGRKKAAVADFLRSIPESLRATIEQVCTDLYQGLVGAVKEVLPHAKVVADRFHVAKLYRAAVDALRKSEMKELKRVLKKEEYAKLKGVMWLLRRHSEDLTPAELAVLEQLFEYSPLLRKAHALREQLTHIFQTKHTKASAKRAIRAWTKRVKRSGLTCFDKFLSTLEDWMDEITHYFVSRLSSGWVEGLNNKIKVLKRRCYGLRNLAGFFRRLWLDLNGYEAFAH